MDPMFALACDSQLLDPATRRAVPIHNVKDADRASKCELSDAVQKSFTFSSELSHASVSRHIMKRIAYMYRGRFVSNASKKHSRRR